ncbi:unnamed protein product, partial [Brachionus calyciflorus]
ELIQERTILSEKTEDIIKAYTYLQSSIESQNQNNGDDSESNVDDEDRDFEKKAGKTLKRGCIYVNRTIHDALGLALRSKNVLDDCTSDEESICSDQEDRFRAVDKWGKKSSKKIKKAQRFLQ